MGFYSGNKTPGDGIPNPPTTPDTRGFLEVFNGSTWDRVRSGGVLGSILVANPVGSAPSLNATVFQGTNPWVVSGTVIVNQGTSPWVVSGTVSVNQPVTVNQGTSPWVVSGSVAVSGPVTSGLLANKSVPSPVADGATVSAWASRNGRQWVHDDRPALLGIYHASTGQSTITAAADAATAGRFWLINPVGSVVLLSLRRMNIQSGISGALAIMLSSPLVTMERVTFTGTASGATIVPAKRDSNDAAPVGSVRTASTGLTIAAGAQAYGYACPAVLAALDVAVYAAPIGDNIYAEDERLVLRPGEGVVFRQATAGSTGDIRNFQVELTWEEFSALGVV